MLIGSYELIQSYVANPQSLPFPQPHSFPFDVRHNLLFAKEAVMNLFKTACPILLRLEFAAVQIIAVDTVQNSGSHIAGYLIKAGHPIHNTVSTGDLNRGRRTESRLLFGSFCRSKKNKPVSLSGAFPCMGGMPLSGQHAARAFLPPAANILVAVATISLPLRGISRGVGTPPRTCTRKACTNTPRFACIGRLLRNHKKPTKSHSLFVG